MILLTATGSVFHNPPANFFRAATNPEECAETTAELFLGVKIKCAKCHNHPFDRWTQDNYHGLAALFHRVARKPGPSSQDVVVYSARRGELVHPRTGQSVAPWLPGVEPAETDTSDGRRGQLATWLGRTDNPFFARVAVNRIWFYLTGRGLVEPVDDFRDSNPPINSNLLNALADDFAASGFDRKHIIGTILNSETYQLSSAPVDGNRDDAVFFSRYRPRRLSAEQLLDAVAQVTQVPSSFADVPQGTRVVARPTPPSDNAFFDVIRTAGAKHCMSMRTGETDKLCPSVTNGEWSVVTGKTTRSEWPSSARNCRRKVERRYGGGSLLVGVKSSSFV